jgi:hypothetical protein
MSVPSIPCVESEFGDACHVSAFFHSVNEEYRVVLPFMKTGFECGYRTFHVIDPGLRDRVARVLLPAVVATRELGRSGGLRHE